MDDFGGGEAVVDPDQAPVVTITSPVAGSFFVVGDTLRLRGVASDAEEDADSLVWAWNVDLLHNNHIHPAVFTSTERAPETVIEDHDDGTGVSFRARLSVSDHAGHTTTRTATIHPEVDLAISMVTVKPETLGTSGQAEYAFTLHNLGRMPASRSRWRVMLGAATLSEGDTLMAARDSVLIHFRAAAPLDTGFALLRVVADTLGAIPEPDEANNVHVRALLVVPGPTRDALQPLLLSGPTASPAATQAWVRWRTDEPSHGVVRFGLTPEFGDSAVFAADALDHDLVLTGLLLDTRYHFQLIGADTLGNEVISLPDSFVTQPSILQTDSAPSQLRLSAAWPNPARGGVNFDLALPRGGEVRFAVYDPAGREVWSSRPELNAGRHVLRWEGRRGDGGMARPGLYFARVRTGGVSQTRRFVLVR